MCGDDGEILIHGDTVVSDAPHITSVFFVLGKVIASLYVRFSSWVSLHASLSPTNLHGRTFHRFGRGSLIMWKPTTIFNEQYISIGEDTLIGPGVALSAGMVPGQECMATTYGPDTTSTSLTKIMGTKMFQFPSHGSHSQNER